jgi:hypothetical protein
LAAQLTGVVGQSHEQGPEVGARRRAEMADMAVDDVSAAVPAPSADIFAIDGVIPSDA